MRKIIFAAMLLSLAAGCVEEGDYYTAMVTSESDPDSISLLRLSFDGATEAATRSILGNSVETMMSGGVVAVYDADTGMLDSEWEVEDFTSPMVIRLPKNSKMNIYVIGNLWYLDSAGDCVCPPFPMKESDVASMVYMMDARNTSAGRTERYGETAVFGIPMSGSAKGVNMSSDVSLKIPLKRLFAKVTLTIDHSGLDDSSESANFENVELYVRQANARLTPFSPGAKALCESDTVYLSDCDPAMSNGRLETYVFYVPENRHGEYPTYIEFDAKVNISAGGYGGKVRYRFYIGSGEDDDYDVEGNQNYRISLGFKVDSLFEPQWQVSHGDDWSDTRQICLAVDSTGSSRLSSNSVIAVRKNRPATCWLYYNRNGDGANEASILTSCEGPVETPDLTSTSWWCEAPDLARNGISMEVTGTKLVFSVTDQSKFVTGKQIPLRLHLYPGDIVRDYVLTMYDDISVSVVGDMSLTDDFFVGMRRQIAISGLAGSTVYYWNKYPLIIESLKAVASLDAKYIWNSKTTSQTIPANTTLDLCAYHFTNGEQFYINLESDDAFNDGGTLLTAKVVVQMPRSSILVDEVYLPFDGRGVDVPFEYKDWDGNPIPKDRFDPEIYEQRLRPGLFWTSGVDPAVPQWIGSEGTEVFLKSYYADGEFIGERTHNTSGLLGMLHFGPSDRTLQYGSANAYLYVRTPYWYAPFYDVHSEYFDTAAASDISSYGIAMISEGISFETELSTTGASGATVVPGPVTDTRCRIDWKFSDTGRTADALAPIGSQTVSLVFTNKRSKEVYRLSSTFDVYHNIMLRPFVLFTEGSATAEVLATTAKNAWILGRYCAGDAGFTRATDFLNLSGTDFPQYVTMKYSSAVGKSKTSTVVYRGSCSMSGRYRYQDFDPSSYGKGYAWTSARISAFASAGQSPLSSLGFCGPEPDYSPITPPLDASCFDGNPYVNMHVSNSYLGCATLP